MDPLTKKTTKQYKQGNGATQTLPRYPCMEDSSSLYTCCHLGQPMPFSRMLAFTTLHQGCYGSLTPP